MKASSKKAGGKKGCKKKDGGKKGGKPTTGGKAKKKVCYLFSFDNADRDHESHVSLQQ